MYALEKYAYLGTSGLEDVCKRRPDQYLWVGMKMRDLTLNEDQAKRLLFLTA